MPISQFLNYIQGEKRYSKHTVSAYQKDLYQFEVFLKEHFEEESICNASPQMIRSWVVNLLDGGLNTRSTNRKISSLKSFFNYALRKKWIETIPTNKIVSPKVKKELPAYVKENEMKQLLTEMTFEQNFSGLRDQLILEILYATGIRLNELIHIKDTDLDLINGTIKVLGKRNKERIIPLHKDIILLIKSFQEVKKESFNEPYLLLTDKGQIMYPKFVYRKVNDYLGQITSSQKRSPHVLRHTFATHMLNNGADLNTIKEFLGHANLSATEVYTHNSIEKLKNVYNQAHPRA